MDPETGYRYFSVDQIDDATAIRRLRFLELALDEIREIVAADDPAFTRGRLLQHRTKMAELAATTEQILASLQRIIEGEEELVPGTIDISDKVEIKQVPAQPVLVIRERKPIESMSQVIPAAYEELEKFMHEEGIEPTGPPITVCPYADDEGMVAIENSVPVLGEVVGGGRIESAVLEACTVVAYDHWGHYEQLDGSYRALASFVERNGLVIAGEPREIYWTGPEDLPPDEWRTEIQFPIVADEVKLAALR